jgi:hypothetical protein
MNPEVYAINIYKFSSYFAENILRLHYKDQLVNAVSDNNPCMRIIMSTQMHYVGKKAGFYDIETAPLIF